jgi:hypothetical protein
MIEAVPWLFAAYLVGSIPASYLAARWFGGIDLREHGSRNLGATNLYRTLGWKFAVPVGLFDVAKGALPTLAFASRAGDHPCLPSLCGLAWWDTPSHRCRVGRQGVATAAGMLGAHPGGRGSRGAGLARAGALDGLCRLDPSPRPPPSARRLDAWPAAEISRSGLDCALAAFIIWNTGAISRGSGRHENRFGQHRQRPSRPAHDRHQVLGAGSWERLWPTCWRGGAITFASGRTNRRSCRR